MNRRNRTGRAAWWVLGIGFLLAAGSGGADDRDGSSPPAVVRREVDDATIERLRRLHYVESAEVRLVLLPASVTDRRGRVVPGLDQDDFRLFDDQVRQRIRYFSADAAEPISIAFLLDVSGSMRFGEKLRHAKEAIRHLVDRQRPGDRFALICFADDQVAWVTDFTEDRARFLRRLEVQEGYGQTALHDAVAAAPDLVDDSVLGRKAIVLVTDGVDNFSELDPTAAIDLAQRVNVPIYTIGFLAVPEKLLPRDTTAAYLANLRSFSAETGGALFAVYDPADLKEAASRLASVLHHQYLIGYYPEVETREDRFHRIRLETGRKRLVVRTRTGYYPGD